MAIPKRGHSFGANGESPPAKHPTLDLLAQAMDALKALPDDRKSDPLYAIALSLAALVQQQAEQINELRAAQHHNAENTAEEMERRRSIVVTGLPEASGTFAEQREKNQEKAYELLDAIGADSTISAVYRMGPKNHAKPRLLKVVLVSSAHQKNALRSAKNLKGLDSYKGVFLRPSLTPVQQKREYELRQELRGLRDAGKKARIVGGWPGDAGRMVQEN